MSERRATSPPGLRPNRSLEDAKQALRAAQDELGEQMRLSSEVQERIAKAQQRLAFAEQEVDAVRSAALSAPVKPRRLLTAYALWLFTPFIWPGAYLFYLGRDTHCWLHTVTFGGFGVGWLLDLVYIPMYVADFNEPPGYLEAAQNRLRRWWMPLSLLTSPLSLALRALLCRSHCSPL